MIEHARKTQKNILDMIDSSYQKGRLSHAYLFVGEQGTEKLGVALYFACKQYCNDVCLECKNCKNILEFKHLNVTYIAPQGQTIKKEQILNLETEFSKTSLEDGPRVYIIDEAHKMTSQAANSLLKFIEEPSDNVYGVLLTDNKTAILPTILSRCQVINMLPTPKEEIIKGLIENDIPEEKANILSQLTNGINDAKRINDNPAFQTSVKLAHDLGLMISNDKTNAVWYFKDYINIFDDQENLDILLKILLLYFMDSIKKNPQIFIDEEVFDKLRKKEENILKIIDTIITIQKRLVYNINYSLALECLLLEIDRGV